MNIQTLDTRTNVPNPETKPFENRQWQRLLSKQNKTDIPGRRRQRFISESSPVKTSSALKSELDTSFDALSNASRAIIQSYFDEYSKALYKKPRQDRIGHIESEIEHLKKTIANDPEESISIDIPSELFIDFFKEVPYNVPYPDIDATEGILFVSWRSEKNDMLALEFLPSGLARFAALSAPREDGSREWSIEARPSFSVKHMPLIIRPYFILMEFIEDSWNQVQIDTRDLDFPSRSQRSFYSIGLDSGDIESQTIITSLDIAAEYPGMENPYLRTWHSL